MLSQEITESPTANHSQSFFVFCLFVAFFFFGCQLKDKFVHKKLVCEFISTFSCHSEFTKENTLIHTPNVEIQGRLIRITTDQNLRYIVLFKIVRAI